MILQVLAHSALELPRIILSQLRKMKDQQITSYNYNLKNICCSYSYSKRNIIFS